MIHNIVEFVKITIISRSRWAVNQSDQIKSHVGRQAGSQVGRQVDPAKFKSLDMSN